jgi:hypothetical protein
MKNNNSVKVAIKSNTLNGNLEINKYFIGESGYKLVPPHNVRPIKGIKYNQKGYTRQLVKKRG